MNSVRCNNKVFKKHITLPASKSESNRLLIMNALTGNKLDIKGFSKAEDTILMTECLNNYKNKSVISADNAGTVFRFFTSFLAMQNGEWTLTGSERMQQRPVGSLVESLRSLNSKIEYVDKQGYPPLLIRGERISGGKVSVDATVSSQFITALLLIAPYTEKGIDICITGKISSWPYINMTLELMSFFGIKYIHSGRHISIQPGNYLPQKYTIEADWSAASFFYEIAALSDECEIFMPGLRESSFQGDSFVKDIFYQLGVKTSFINGGVLLTKTSLKNQYFIFNFSDHPDLFLPVAVTCAVLGLSAKCSGIRSLRHKESDRYNVFCNEIRKLGYNVEIVNDDSIVIHGRISNQNTNIINTYSDHRIAMAFAPIAISEKIINFDDISVVKKSFPDFWKEMQGLGFDII